LPWKRKQRPNTALTNTLSGKSCEVFSTDLRLQIEQRDIFTYPDVMVVWGQPVLFEDWADTITNPTVIIEVLSESTERYDRSDKFHAYWTLETLVEYVLVNQYQLRVEYFRRSRLKSGNCWFSPSRRRWYAWSRWPLRCRWPRFIRMLAGQATNSEKGLAPQQTSIGGA
jgi:hypothetical protein